MLIPPDMRLHLTKHNVQALSPHVRSWRNFSGPRLQILSLVPAKDEVASCLVFSPSEANFRQLPDPYARGECRSDSMEGR